MKKLFGLFLFAALIGLQSCTTIPQNEEGVAIHRTERDSSKIYEAVSGRMFTMFDVNIDYITVPMYQQKGNLAHVEVKSSDRATFGVDSIGYAYQPERGHGVSIIKNYRQFTSSDNFLDIVEDQVFEMQLSSIMKQTALKYTADSLLSYTPNFIAEVTEKLNTEFKKRGFNFQSIKFDLHEPAAIKNILEAKAKSLQEAEAAKAKATEAQSRQIVVEAEQKSRIAEATADLEVAKIEAQKSLVQNKTYTKEYLDYLKIYYWGEANCPPQTVIYSPAGSKLDFSK